MLNSLRKPLLALNADCCRPPSPGQWGTNPWKEKMAIEQEINRQACWDWNSVITAQVGAKRICQNCIDIVWFIMYYHASWDVLLGLYYCHASNSLGEGSCHLELTGEFWNLFLSARLAKDWWLFFFHFHSSSHFHFSSHCMLFCLECDSNYLSFIFSQNESCD